MAKGTAYLFVQVLGQWQWRISGAVLYSCVKDQLSVDLKMRRLLVMLSPAFGLKHWYHAVTKSACFCSRLAYSTKTTAGIMLTFCNQYKSSKTTYVVNDFGPHTDSILGGVSDLYASIYIRHLY